MARWEPGTRERLRHAALDLFVERGSEHVTAEEIAARAGLGRRTFFRYFADRREVLFAGSEQLPPAVAEAARQVDPTCSPAETVLATLALVGERLTAYADRAAERRAVIASSPELQERERTKLAAVAEALVDVLGERGVEPATARLLAGVGMAALQAAWARWVDAGGELSFSDCFGDAVAQLRRALAPSQE